MLESKYIIFFIGSAITLPIGVIAAINSRRIHDFVFIFLVFGTTQPYSLFGLPTEINFLSRDWYRGTTLGIEISYLDLLAIILLISSIAIRRRQGYSCFWPRSLSLLFMYLFWCMINVFILSDPKLFGIFELTKIVRGILLFVAVTMYIRSPREIRLLIWSLAITMIYEAVICLFQRYTEGYWRIQGTLTHPNSLSSYCLQFLPILLATIFTTSISAYLRYICILSYFCSVACVIMSISRTGFAAMLILSIAGLFLFPGTRILSPRNAVVIATILLVCSIMLIKSSDTIANRLLGFDIEREYFSEEGDRGTYFRQATPAIRDNLITGIGLNNWSYWITNRYASLTGYTTLNDRPMTAYTGTDIAPEGFGQAPPAHNLYLLTLTEVGLPGLVLFLLVIAHWLYSTGKSLFVRNRTLTGDFQVAAFFSLGATLMQSWTEWTFRQTNQFFLTHIIIAAALSISYMNLSKRPSLPRVSAQQVLNPDPRKATP